ncbi:MAG: twin-arginine translocation signal domain-containing protein, partial [Anaerolineae bacterium]
APSRLPQSGSLNCERLSRKNNHSSSRGPQGISRRGFLKMAAAGAAGLLAGCRPVQKLAGSPTPPLAEQAIALPTGVATATPTIVPPSTPLSQVAIAQADTYDQTLRPRSPAWRPLTRPRRWKI